MPETDDDITTVTEKNPDAALLKLIAKYEHLSDESAKLDEESTIAHRTGELLRAKQLSSKCDETFNKASALFWELIHRDALTLAGHGLKIKMVASSEFDSDDLVGIAWALGHEAGRLGLGSRMPQLQPVTVPKRMVAAS
jgi:hypothetical protein